MTTVNVSWLYRLLAGVLLLATVGVGWATEDRIAFKDISLHPAEQAQVLVSDIQLEYQLSDYLRNGLLNGMTLESEVSFILEWHSTWWWNTQKKLVSVRSRLKYHPLSKQYQVVRLDNDKSWSFPNLVSALEKLGELQNYHLPKLPDNAYNNDAAIFITASLRPESLELPLKVQALFSDRYSLTTDGVLWPLP